MTLAIVKVLLVVIMQKGRVMKGKQRVLAFNAEHSHGQT